jgi:hypothetical protein
MFPASMSNRELKPTSVAALLVFVTVSCALTGCGSDAPPTGNPASGQSTTVALQLSSTANDEFVAYKAAINSITLTNQAGKTVTIYSATTPTPIDFIHSNGSIAPLATVAVPQDTYTSAALALTYPQFDTTSIDSSGAYYYSTWEVPGPLAAPVVVSFASPLTVSGTAMGITLDLQASQSGTFPANITPGVFQPFTITPTFNIEPFVIPQTPTPANGIANSIPGRVLSIAPLATAFQVTLANFSQVLSGGSTSASPKPQTFTVATNSTTVFQHISSIAALAPGDFVDLDLTLQQDGSLLATRVDVPDATANNMAWGTISRVDPSANLLTHIGIIQQGNELDLQPVALGLGYTYSNSTVFQTSGAFPNLTGLPFTASFSSTSLAPGQRVAVGSPTLNLQPPPPYIYPSSSVTLIPQTIDGTVTSVASNGSYTVYAVSLTPNDPITSLNVANSNDYADYTINGANTVTVYADASTVQLNAASVTLRSTYRFNGLLFNDTGTLRMLCRQINDGVPQ